MPVAAQIVGPELVRAQDQKVQGSLADGLGLARISLPLPPDRLLPSR